MANKGKKKTKGAAKKSPKKPSAAKRVKKKGTKKPAKKPVKKPARGAAKPSKARKPAAKPGKKAPAARPSRHVKVPDIAEPITHDAPGDTGDAIGEAPADTGEPIGDAGEPSISVAELAGKAMIINILGDAEAYFFDFTKLARERRDELIAHHLAAFDQRKRSEGKDDWQEDFVPIALLGESMPPPIRGQFDLSAPHEGVLLQHPTSGALLYAASKDDDKLAIFAPDLVTIAPRESFVSDVFDPDAQSYAYAVDRTQSQGFTLSEIETLMQTVGAELTLV